MMNKKADLGGQTMIYVFLAIVIIITTSISIGIGMFFSQEYDYRALDSQALTDQISKCLSRPENPIPTRENQQQFLDKCRINERVINDSFFILIESEDTFYQVGRGNPTQCALADKNDAFLRCTNHTIIKNDKKIFIQTGSNQIVRRLKA